MADRKSTIYDLEAEKIKEKIIIFAADTGGYTQKEVSLEIQASLDELTELIDTAGAEVVGRLVQNRDRIANDLYLGRGKVEELREMIYELGATGVCCDDELSPAQLMNLQDALDIKVMDRTMVILDIFAAHAGSYEGKLQVELAQLKFRATRLVGMRDSLSRLGGGIGTRGPGEKKLEIDRRVIRDRISRLKAELRNVESQRSQQRKQRQRSAVPVVGIVGYTNAGKSTLLNALTGAGVLQEDKLFATLDPTTRGYKLPGGQNILLTDTVGFIRKLPHHLIEAFKSTLEEAKYADYILHVVDASNPQHEKQMHIVYDTLYQLDIREKTVITLFNKQDAVTEREPLHDLRADHTLAVSAREGTGLDELKELLAELLRENKVLIERTIAYADAGILQQIRKQGELLEEDYRPEGIYVKAYVPLELYGKL